MLPGSVPVPGIVRIAPAPVPAIRRDAAVPPPCAPVSALVTLPIPALDWFAAGTRRIDRMVPRPMVLALPLSALVGLVLAGLTSVVEERWPNSPNSQPNMLEL